MSTYIYINICLNIYKYLPIYVYTYGKILHRTFVSVKLFEMCTTSLGEGSLSVYFSLTNFTEGIIYVIETAPGLECSIL